MPMNRLFNTIVRTGAGLALAAGLSAALLVLPARAAEILILPKSMLAAPGQTFEVDAVISTGNESVNAVEGKLVFPAAALELTEVRDGNSIVSFWIEQPACRGCGRDSGGEIAFSGIVPGGYAGQAGVLFTAVFRAKQDVAGSFTFKDTRLLRNDGHGGVVPLELLQASVTVRSEALSSGRPPAPTSVSQEVIAPAPPARMDNDPPEDFTPLIASEPAMFDGRWFLSFSAKDKGTGVDHYEVYEGPAANQTDKSLWRRAESPYELKDQTRAGLIIVKAVDRDGNERMAAVETPVPKPLASARGQWYVLAACVAALITAIVVFLWKKRSKKD